MAMLVRAASAVLTLTGNAFAQTPTSSVSYATPNRGGAIIETAGGAGSLVIGYGRVQPSASTTPAGVAIFGFRSNGVLVTEAGVPGMTAITSGRTYAEAASNEASASSTAELIFPHIVDRGGYTTQFILFSGIASQSTAGTLRFFAQDGRALNVTVR